ICESRFVDGLSDAQVESLFNVARDAEYTMILKEARAGSTDTAGGPEAASLAARLRRRLTTDATIDFFGAPARGGAESAVAELERRAQSAQSGESEKEGGRGVEEIDLSGGRTWVTRRGIHVDRMASAWLIRRFIDPAARFKFVTARGYEPEPGELRFDMFEAEYTHTADCCTFEVLLSRFSVSDPALRPIAEIVHDIDLKDEKFGREDTPGIERLVAGIALAHRDDEARLSRATAMLDDLYEYFRKKRA